MSRLTTASASIVHAALASVRSKVCVPNFRPPSRRLAPSTKRTLPRMLPASVAFTVVVRPARKRDDRDNQFGGIAECRVEQATQPRPGIECDFLRRPAKKPGERDERERADEKDERWAGMHDRQQNAERHECEQARASPSSRRKAAPPPVECPSSVPSSVAAPHPAQIALCRARPRYRSGCLRIYRMDFATGQSLLPLPAT